jgi:hypothetical protein
MLLLKIVELKYVMSQKQCHVTFIVLLFVIFDSKMADQNPNKKQKTVL